ncbi:hypothetical protein [Kordiimonas aquimaris]|uniref:hypothetical protein n=1 Tax=Kordiimonas aquimaris TaxID=707591 RepID=UPI0021D0AA72|nr:hypothetical protein [Kordiimonas aquimaris]
MSFHSDAEIDRIAEGIKSLTLPKREWTHAAHFAAAVWFTENPDYNAQRDMPSIIWRYNEATGVENTDTGGYHETITQASLLATSHMVARVDSSLPLYEKVNRIIASPFGKPDWLLAYWSKDVLFSVQARRVWVGPDIKPLVFS